MEKVYWLKQDTPVELHAMLFTLAEEYPIFHGKLQYGIQIKLIKSKE